MEDGYGREEAMRVRTGTITRDLNNNEDYTGYADILTKGTIVYSYSGTTYGCISHDGEAVTMKPGETPFFEVPGNAIEWDNP